MLIPTTSPKLSSTNREFLTSEIGFGLDLLRQTPVNDSLVVSPVSILLALTLIHAGATGRTKVQLNNVLAKGATDSEIVHHYSTLSKQVSEITNGVRSMIANGFFMDDNFVIESKYRDFIMSNYNAKVEAYDFSSYQQTAQIIDEFVKNSTDGKISDMVRSDTIKGAQSLIINAIYFCAEWEKKFSKNESVKGNFYTSHKASREVVYMRARDVRRRYAENSDMQVLSLSYNDTNYAMNIFLPKKRFGIDAFRQKVNETTILKMLGELKATTISTIAIPKLKIETNFMLMEALASMGVTEMFTENAQLDGIAKWPHLYISDASHRAIIEMNEDSTTAAAATHAKKSYKSFTFNRKIFLANHPFFFIVTMSSHPLFMGQFT